MPPNFALPVIFVFGLLLGSFLNVLIYRIDDLESILITRSHCPSCKRQLAWYDLIPLLSFVLLRTRCRHCGKPISWQYPVVELLTALLLLAIYLKWGLSPYAIVLMLASLILIVIFFTDLEHYLIPDELIGVGVVLLILAEALNVTGLSFLPLDWPRLLLGGSIGGGLLGFIALVSRGKGMGWGDVKLGLLLGLLLGYPLILIGLLLAFLVGSLVGLVLVSARRRRLEDHIPFGPFLIAGAFAALFYGGTMLAWYLRLAWI